MLGQIPYYDILPSWCHFFYKALLHYLKTGWNNIPTIFGSSKNYNVYSVSSGHYGRPRGFHDISLYREDIYPNEIFRSCYIYIRHCIDNHFRLSSIPNLVFHDPSSYVPRRSIGRLSNVTSTVENEIVGFCCSPFKVVKFKWISNKKNH